MIKINYAGIDELTSIKGIGPVIANRIVKACAFSGNFKNALDLADIPHLNLDQETFDTISFEENPKYQPWDKGLEMLDEDNEVSNLEESGATALSTNQVQSPIHAQQSPDIPISKSPVSSVNATTTGGFMGSVKSLIDLKIKQMDKWAAEGVKLKPSNFTLPPPLKDSYNSNKLNF